MTGWGGFGRKRLSLKRGTVAAVSQARMVKPVGRPRTRWVNVVQRDALQLLGVRGWRRRAKNRDEWRYLMREAKARKGL